MFLFRRYSGIIHNICRHITSNHRKFNKVPKYAFIIDNSYDLVKKLKKLKQQNNCIPQVDPVHGYPSSFARNLLHPFSNHMVSKYASEYYKKAKPYYLGEYPMQFFASEMSCITPHSSCPNPSNTHSIVLFPHQIRIKEIEVEHIPYIVSLCANDSIIRHLVHSNDPRIEKIEGININFFCDVATIDTTLTLFQWFDYCFRRSNFSKVNYVFSSGNLKNDQSSTILIHNEKTQIVLSQHMVLREVDYIVQHMISTYSN